jgi:hypothetical protein
MLLAANLLIKGLYDSTVEFFAQRSPIISSALGLGGEESDSETNSIGHAGVTHCTSDSSDPFARTRSTRESTYSREGLGIDEHRRCHDTCSCPSCNYSPSPYPSYAMRKNSREQASAKNNHARMQVDLVRLEEKCKALEVALQESREMMKVKDAEIERLRRAVDRPSADRCRSDDQRPEPDPHELHDSSRRSQCSSRRSHDSQRSEQQAQGAVHNSNSNIYTQSSEESHDGSVSSDSEEERAHMRGLDTFLTKVDRWSGAQIIQALQDLNSEILQFAASATELCTFDKYSRSSPSRTSQSTKETAARLGSSLARLLSARDHTQDPILVQLALQSCVATCIARAMSTFCFGFAAKPNAVLSQIYSQMYISGMSFSSIRASAL